MQGTSMIKIRGDEKCVDTENVASLLRKIPGIDEFLRLIIKARQPYGALRQLQLHPLRGDHAVGYGAEEEIPVGQGVLKSAVLPLHRERRILHLSRRLAALKVRDLL